MPSGKLGACTFQLKDLESSSIYIQSLPLADCVALDKSSLNFIFFICKTETLMYLLYSDVYSLNENICREGLGGWENRVKD